MKRERKQNMNMMQNGGMYNQYGYQMPTSNYMTPSNYNYHPQNMGLYQGYNQNENQYQYRNEESYGYTNQNQNQIYEQYKKY